MPAKKPPESAPTSTAGRAAPPRAPGEPMTAGTLDQYELDLLKREEETRAPAPITNEETAELLAVASKLRQGGDSPLVFLLRAFDAQQRLARDPAVVGAKTKEEMAAAVLHLLEEPETGPDVISSPRLLNKLRALRLGAAQTFSTEPVPFDPEKEFGWVSRIADYHADTSPLLKKLSLAIGVPRTKKHTAAEKNAEIHELRVFQWTTCALKAALKKACATSSSAAQGLIEGELEAAGVPTDLCPRLAALALKSRDGREPLEKLLASWLGDLKKSLIQAADSREHTEHARAQAAARAPSLSALAERRRQPLVLPLTAEQVTDKASDIIASEHERERIESSERLRHLRSLKKRFARPK